MVALPPAAAPVPLSTAAVITREANALGLLAAHNRVGEDPLSTLRPTTAADAKPASLSAVVGLDAQPLHTDGAHLKRVPDYVLLWCAEPSATPTRIWSPWNAVERQDQHGIFVVKSGRNTWLAPAIDSHRSLRFDPICMTPGDSAARRLTAALQSPPAGDVHSVLWDSPGKILLLRNRQVLHGRAAVIEGDTHRKLERIAYYRSAR